MKIPTKQQIIEILKNHHLIKLKEKPKRIFIIGSRVNDNIHSESDLDILLEVKTKQNITSEELTEQYRIKLKQYFMKYNIKTKADYIHPLWENVRIDLYFTYNANNNTKPIKEIK
jgi:predicted nucleotidyltransferase